MTVSADPSNHWKVGIAFVLGCVGVGSLLAVANTQPDDALETTDYETTVPVISATNSETVSGEGRESEANLSYQELLQRNGDIDGRSKDYFTQDGDEEFGGAVVGMDYADFRDRLRFAGFIPLELEKPAECVENPGYIDCNYQYPETETCSGTGEAFCVYIWSKGDDDFFVMTREGEGGQVVEMSYIR